MRVLHLRRFVCSLGGQSRLSNMGSCISTHSTGVSNIKKHVTGRRQRKREMKREAMEALTNEEKNDSLLAVIPGRLFGNGASTMACLFTQQGRKGTNQDAMVVWEGIASSEDTVFCGVFDGHGPFGHLVARRVRNSLPSKIVAHWQEETAAAAKDSDTEGGEQPEFGDTTQTDHGSNVSTAYESAVSDVEESQCGTLPVETTEIALQGTLVQEPSMFRPWKESHLTAYKMMDTELRTHPAIDCFCSGSTTVTVLKQGKHLVIGNVGDSRAIMGSKDENNMWKAIQLTVDLKPNLPQEAERIRQCKGRVFALQDEPDVSRVWLPFDDSPGLAMARAFGDFCLKDYGVIAVPEITYRQLTDKDQFIVLATDGIWDVLSNEEVVHIITAAPTRSTAARSLVESAVRVWRLKYPTSKVDDCAVVCLYLDCPVTISGHDTSKERPSTEISSEVDVPAHENHMKQATTNDQAAKSDTTYNSDVMLEGPLSTQNTVSVPVEVGEIENGDPSKEIKRTESRRPRSLADWLVADEDEWSALEGVTRVNSLLNLPRFAEDDQRSEGPTRK